MFLNILTWNCRGIMSSAYPLSQILDTYSVDIALTVEHKLMPHSALFMDSIHSNYSSLVNLDRSLDC